MATVFNSDGVRERKSRLISDFSLPSPSSPDESSLSSKLSGVSLDLPFSPTSRSSSSSPSSLSRAISPLPSPMSGSRIDFSESEANLKNEIHDIKNAAFGVLGQGEQLQNTLASMEKQIPHGNFAALNRDLQELLAASRYLFSVTKTSLGGNNLDTYESVEIWNVVRPMAEPEARKKKIDLKFTCYSPIPDRFKGPNPYWINKVLSNFVLNAIRFSKDGGTVEIGMEITGRMGSDIRVRFSVKDTGIGMSTDDQAKLFSPLRKSGEAVQVGAKDRGGTGQGLGGCIDEVNKMNPGDSSSHIGVVSELGQGSTFWFEAPFTLVSEIASVKKEDDVEFFSSLRVLVAEDNKMNQKLLGRMLGNLGISKVEFADNGKEALEKYVKDEFDVILMDVNMPVMNGNQASEAIRKYENDNQKSNIAILATSANDDEEPMNMTASLKKPFTKDALKTALLTHVKEPSFEV